MPPMNVTRLGKELVSNFKVFKRMMFAPEKPKPLGRWIVNDSNWITRAEYATSDSCGGDLCRKHPPKYTPK
jgi:hypothetical protein